MDRRLKDMSRRIEETLATLRDRDDLNIDQIPNRGISLIYIHKLHVLYICYIKLLFGYVFWEYIITLGTIQRNWDNEVISNTRLERTEEEFRRRLNGQIDEQGHVAEREFGERLIER